MAEEEGLTPLSRGVVWRRFRAGSPVGRALGAWAYTTPLHPEGLDKVELKASREQVQIETAISWFFQNYKPYNLSTGGPWFGFAANNGTVAQNTAGFEEGKFAPTPLAALDVLEMEFDGVLPRNLLRRLGDALTGHWMLINELPSGIEPTTRPELIQAALRGINDLRQLFTQLRPEHGKIGHNVDPGADASIKLDEVTAAIEALSIIEKRVAGPSQLGLPDLKELWNPVVSVAGKISVWAFGHLDTFIKEFIAEAGPALGKAAPKLVYVGLAAWAAHGPLFNVLLRLVSQ